MKVITKDNFEAEVTNSSKVVLLDSWAPWCPPCRAMNPVLEELQGEVSDWAEVAKLDVEAEPELAQKLGITSLPTFQVYKGGQVVTSTVGATSKANLISMMSQAK